MLFDVSNYGFIKQKGEAMLLDGTINLECSCQTMEHNLRFILDKKEREIFVEFFLSDYLPWWKRIIPAIKYLLGMKRHHTDFDCFIMKEEDIETLRNHLTKFLKDIGPDKQLAFPGLNKHGFHDCNFIRTIPPFDTSSFVPLPTIPSPKINTDVQLNQSKYFNIEEI